MAEVVGKRNAQKQETKLVEVGTEKRDFGQDTLQAALGLLGSAHQPTADYGLQLDERDCICIVRALDQLARKCRGNADFEQAVSSAPYGYRIKAHVNCHSPVALARDYPSVAAGKMKSGTDLAYTMLIRHARTGRRTQLVCSVRCDSNGKCWLNIRANPTSLLAGYNAHGLALEGRNEHSERGIFMRLPFAMLRMIAQSVDPNFKWQDKTASRIAELAFKIGNTQVFTYVKPPISLSDYMSFLQCCYGIPFASPRHNYCSIATALRLKIMSEGHNGLIETLLVRRMAGFVGGDADRGVVSICMYDKAAKARADAAAIDIEVGSAEAMEFLKQHLRVDITMHEAALRKLLAEAGFSEGTEVTARNYRDAIKRLDDGKGKSKQRFSA